VNSLSASGEGEDVAARGFGLFEMSMDLTEEGLEKTDHIMGIVFQVKSTNYLYS
jgi:secreted Zn-dependent insulinase-like peptidase